MKIESKQMFEEIRDGDGDWEIVEEGDWIQEHKSQYCTNIVKHVPTGVFYRYSLGRSGSPFSDWNYDHEYGDFPDLEAVELKEEVVVKKSWVRIPQPSQAPVVPVAPKAPSPDALNPWSK